MGKSIEKYNGEHIELPDDIYKLQQDDLAQANIISITKVIGAIVLVTSIFIISIVSAGALDIVIVASGILTAGFMALVSGKEQVSGCVEAVWKTIKFTLIMAFLALVFYAFMVIR